MQLYSGTLRDLLDERRKTKSFFDAELIAEMALEIASGIEFLHKHNVIHRDIKSGNIFITRNEAGDVTKLAVGDFDTSLRVQASQMNLKDKDTIKTQGHSVSQPSTAMFNVTKARANETTEKRTHFAQHKPRSTVGTAGFMAPEVLGSKNSTPYGFKADIYSFGMVLYEMITLKLPFEHLDTMDIIDAVLEDKPVESMEIDDNIRDKYWSLIDLHKKCTARYAQDRPSWKTILSMLTSVAKGESSNRRPTLTSQKSRMSLTAQLSLYDIRRDADNSFESIEEIEQNSQTVKNGSVRFRGPQILHVVEETTEEVSESTEAEIPFSVYKNLNQVAKEKKQEFMQEDLKVKQEQSLKQSVNVKSAVPSHLHSSSSEDLQQDRIRGSEPLETLAVCPAPRRFTRKIILEIKDNSGNVIREEILENSEEEESERSERIAQLDEMANAPAKCTTSPQVRPLNLPREKKKKKRFRSRTSGELDKEKTISPAPKKEKQKSPRSPKKDKPKSPRDEPSTPRSKKGKSPRKSSTPRSNEVLSSPRSTDSPRSSSQRKSRSSSKKKLTLSPRCESEEKQNTIDIPNVDNVETNQQSTVDDL